MSTSLEAAKKVLSGKTEYSVDQYKDMTKVLLSLGCSYDDINDVRTTLKKGGPTPDALIKLCGLIANNQGVFNTLFSKKESFEEFVKTIDEAAAKTTNGVKWNLESETKRRAGDYHVVIDKRIKKMIAFGLTKTGAEQIAATDKVNFSSMHADDFNPVNEDTLSEEINDKLKNDVASLKKIGWNLDKITKKLITSKEYGDGVTSDIIASLFSPPKMKTVKIDILKLYAADKRKDKRVEWPKDPKGRQVKDQSHAENFLAQASHPDNGSPDMAGDEAHELLRQAGYADETIMATLHNMGLDADMKRGPNVRRMAKKTPKKPE